VPDQLVERVTGEGLLRRRMRRDARERLLDEARHLPAADRLLVEQVYRHGMRLSDVATLIGRDPEWVGRRVRRLVARTRDPVYRYVTRRSHRLSKPRRAVALAVIVEGRTLRDTADATRLSLHAVREHLIAVKALARSEG